MGLSEARGLVLFRVIRGGIGVTRRLGARRHRVVYRPFSYSPSNPSVSRTDWPPTEKITGDGRALHPRRSSGLRFQFFCVEGFSLLPKSQRDGCNLACQRETRHGRLGRYLGTVQDAHSPWWPHL